MRSSGVNKAVAVIAIMNDWIVSDSSFYRKNPDDLAAAAARVAPASRRLSGGRPPAAPAVPAPYVLRRRSQAFRSEGNY